MFIGGKELILFEGVVEDRKDPLFLGRVRVRAIGFHDPDLQKMPTDTLPWATTLQPPSAASNILTYKEGDFVVGYFRDGEAKQYPVILGKIPGIPETPANPQFGFSDQTPESDLVEGKVARPVEMIPPPTPEQNAKGDSEPPQGKYDDPQKLPVEYVSTGQLSSEFGTKPFPYDVNGDGKYDAVDAAKLITPSQEDNGIFGDDEGGPADIPQIPISRYPLEHMLQEPNTSRLARNEKTDQTIVARKKGALITAPTATHAAMGVGTDKANEGETMGEPTTPYNAKYPFNNVYESESGHVIEYDDTPTAERLHFYHRSGTFREMHPDGKQVDKAVNDRYDLSKGNANYAAEKSVNVTAKEELRAHAANAMILESGSEMCQDSGGDRSIFVGGNSNTRIKKNVYTVIDGDVRILIKGNLNVAVEGDVKVKSKGDVLVDGINIINTAFGLNTLRAGAAVTTEGPLTYTNTAITTGLLIKATYADAAGLAKLVAPLPDIPPTPPGPTPLIKVNDADNKDNVVTSPTPKEGYLLNADSMVRGQKSGQDLYKPQSDSDGKAVVLTLTPGVKAKLYEALPTGQLQDAKIEYKHKDGRIVQWNVKRPAHRKGKLIEVGRYAGNGNGGREHWRFSKPGEAYPKFMILEIGDREYLLVESITRHEAL